MASFGDANLYQTWSYDRVRYKPQRVVHMVMRRQHTVVATAQARVLQGPGAMTGIAYVRWGPLWRPIGEAADTEVFRQAVRALRQEFSYRRGLLLRLYPLAYRGYDDVLAKILREEGYDSCAETRSDRTLLIDLGVPLDELRAALDQKWRNRLNRAQKLGLELICGDADALFEEFAQVHHEMSTRKGLVAPNDLDHLRMVQRDLPSAHKLRVILCRLNGEPCAGAIFSAMGTTAVYLKGATSDNGLQTNGSYLVQWAFLRWAKEQGFSHYDLNGIHPEENPGTYHFKRGLAGKHGRDVEFLGRFQVADRALSAYVVKGGEWLLARYRQLVNVTRPLRPTPTA
jgi:Acetyltransferase (GNAT) domain